METTMTAQPTAIHSITYAFRADSLGEADEAQVARYAEQVEDAIRAAFPQAAFVTVRPEAVERVSIIEAVPGELSYEESEAMDERVWELAAEVYHGFAWA